MLSESVFNQDPIWKSITSGFGF